MKQFSLKKLLAVILSIMLVMAVMPMAAFAADEPNDAVGNDYGDGKLIVDGDLVTLSVSMGWHVDAFTGDWTPAYDTFIPKVVAKYNENHGTEYTVEDINAIKYVGVPDHSCSMNAFFSFLRDYGYASRLVELDLSESYFVEWTWDSSTPLFSGRFAAYDGASYFPNLKVLKLDTVKATKVGYSTFNNMTSLETVTLPNSVTNIENDAFKNCSSLKSISIPDAFNTMGVYVFYGCSSLESWSYHGPATTLSPLFGDNCMGVTPYKRVDLSGSGLDAAAVLALKDDLTYLNLTDCDNIDYKSEKGLELYAKVVNMRNNGAEVIAPALDDFNMDEITDKVEGYGGCNARVYVENDIVALNLGIVWKFDEYTGEWTPALDTLIPEALAKYNENHGTEYAKADIKKIVVNGNADAPSSLNGFINFLKNNGYASNLVELDLSESNFVSWTWNSSHMVEGDLFAQAYGDSFFPNLKVLKLGSVAVSAISYNAFNNMTSLETIELPASITSIGPGAFESCSSLKAIDFPTTMTSLGDYAFYGCSALESWSYHGTGDCAATILAQLNEFTSYKKVDLSGSGIDAAAALTIKSDVTYLNLNDCTNIDYATAEGEELFKKILTLQQAGAEVYAPENPYYDPYEVYDTVKNDYGNGRLIVKGDKVTLKLFVGWHVDAFTGDWTPQLDTFIPTVVAKYNENHDAELTVEDINAIKFIGDPDHGCSMNAFSSFLRSSGYASRLVELDLSESYLIEWTWETGTSVLKNERFAAYNGASYFPNLKVLKLDTVYSPTIQYNAFNNMTSLETITLPNNLETIENDAFKGCSSLKSIDFPRYLKNMGVYVFYGCSSLESWSYHGANATTIPFFGENNLNVTPYSRVDLSGSSVDAATALGLKSSLTYLNLDNCPNIEYESESGKALWSRILQAREAGAEIIAPDNANFDYDEAMDTVVGEGGEWSDAVDARIMTEDDLVVLKLTFKWEYNDYTGTWTPQLDRLVPKAINQYNNNHNTELTQADITKVVVISPEDDEIDLAFSNFIKFLRGTDTSNTAPFDYAANIVELDFSEAAFTGSTVADWDDKILCNTLFAPYDGATYFPNLKSLDLGRSKFVTIQYNAFNNMTALEEIILPPNLQTIESAAFKGSSALKAIDLPSTLNSIDRYAFEGCTALDAWSYHGSAEGAADVAGFYNDLFVGFRDVQKVYTKVDLSGSTVNADNVRRISSNATYVNLTDCPNVYIGAKGTAAYAKIKELRDKGAEVIAPELVFGDADNDGTVGAEDLVILKKILLLGESLIESEGLNAPACDANDDGAIDIRDLVRSKKAAAGI